MTRQQDRKIMKLTLPQFEPLERSARYTTAWCVVTRHLYPRTPEEVGARYRDAPYSYEEALLMFDVVRRHSWCVRRLVLAVAKRPSTRTWETRMNALLDWWEMHLELERRYLGTAEDFYAHMGSNGSQKIRDRRRRLDSDEAALEAFDMLLELKDA
jgi:hypothetical protein